MAEHFADGEPVSVVLGYDIIENNICTGVDNFKSQKRGAETLLKEVSGAGRFGVAKIRGDSVISIEEEPRAPKSDYAVIGVYLYDPAVLPEDPPPDLEITGVNNFYAEEGALTYEILDGWRTDAGTFESLLRANNLLADTDANKMTVQSKTAVVATRELAR